ncbi:MAG: hypothetical protein HGB08_02155 [Candidatus Moranbacteria bacterium]|nr:hypothetical protein [Candidatus Moranbacteria bacterium]
MFEEILKKIRSWFKHEYAWAVLLAIINLAIIRNIFNTGFLMGADEFSLQYDGFFIQKTSTFAWNDWMNLGHSNLSINNIPYVLFFNLFHIVFSPQAIERVLYFLLLFFCGYSMFLLLVRSYRTNYSVATAFSLFYTYNLHYVVSPLALNVKLVYIVLPITILVIKKYLIDRKLLKFIILMPFSLLIIAQASSNPPAVSIVYFLILSYLTYIIIGRKIRIKEVVFFSIGASFMFILINAWWLSTLAPSMLESSVGISKGLNATELRVSENLTFFNVMRYMGYAPWWQGEGYGHRYVQFATVFENSGFLVAYSFIPIIFVLGAVFFAILDKKSKKEWVGKEASFWIFIFLSGVFLSKGPSAPLGFIFKLCWDHVPGFWIFREPWAKFIPLVILSSTVLGAQLFDFFLKKTKYFSVAVLSIAIITVYFYALTPEIYYSDNFLTMRTIHTEVPDYWKEYENEYAKKKLLMRNIALPKAFNGSHLFQYGFSGPLPFVSLASRQPFVIYPNFSDTGYYNDNAIKAFYDSGLDNPRVLGYLGTGYITQQNDYNWIAGYDSTPSPRKMREILQAKYFLESKSNFGKFTSEYLDKIDPGVKGDREYTKIIRDGLKDLSGIDTYDFRREYFLPLIYVPKETILTEKDVSDIADVSSENGDGKDSSVIYFLNQDKNIGKYFSGSESGDDVIRKGDNLPTLEFKKISPTKYRIRVHAAQGEFPLVFSESFHDGWKMYLEKSASWRTQNQSLDSYKILDGNEEDQASADEVKEYIRKGWVSDLGNGKSIGFVSKDFQGTIQNDNLPDGSIFENWLARPIEDSKTHLIANSYANAWMMDSDQLCRNSGNCIRNPDGSYDLELVMEYQPQRIFYIGIFISIVSILGAAIYLSVNISRSIPGKNRNS